MIVEALDEYIEMLAGYIYDNDKLVTYKWLSKELEIHVNVAKQILWEFGQHPRDQGDIVRTFLLMGTLHDGGMRVEVVKEENLSSAKEKFSKIICEHIYSLQKALPDIELLAISGDGDVRYSAIQCKESVERSEEEMRKLRWGITLSNDIPVATEKPKSVPDPVKEKREKSPDNKTVGAKKSVQQKGFNNLFGKVANKQVSPPSMPSNATKSKSEIPHETKKSPPKGNSSKSPKQSTQKGGLDSFFKQGESQGTVKKPTASKDKEVTKPTALKEKETPKSDASENTNSSTNNKVKEKSAASTSKNQKKDSRGKKRNRSKESSATAKKRKRITVQSDSSDTGSGNEEEDERELSPEPEPEPEHASPVKARSPSPPNVTNENGKRRVLKMVDKTYMEDGYFVTKKVHVYESCSEDEAEVVQPKKLITPEPRSEPKGKKNTKQSTLTNFFKKS